MMCSNLNVEYAMLILLKGITSFYCTDWAFLKFIFKLFPIRGRHLTLLEAQR